LLSTHDLQQGIILPQLFILAPVLLRTAQIIAFVSWLEVVLIAERRMDYSITKLQLKHMLTNKDPPLYPSRLSGCRTTASGS
jgi:hypothetical protein